MIILPAIDLMDGCAVRLYKGDYAQKTVYSTDPTEVMRKFAAAGAEFAHVVDLDGAKSGLTPNLETVKSLVRVGVPLEVGGGIRSMETVERYLDAGVARVILGTAAVKDRAFLEASLSKYGEKIAVGVDLRDGYVAVSGWTEKTDVTSDVFFADLDSLGVKTVICTDISRDGVMKGTNRELYRELSGKYKVNIVASGGVSSMEDIEALARMDIYGAIVGKAYYLGAIDIEKAIKTAKSEK